MQILVKNTYGPELKLSDVKESFWSDDCLYMGDSFSLSDLMEQTDLVGLSPFYFLDPRVAFGLFQLKEGSLYARGLGSVGTVAAFMMCKEGWCAENRDQILKNIKEYLPFNPLKDSKTYDQIMTFGEKKIDDQLWEKLKVGGFYYLSSTSGKIDLGDKKFEAFGKLWPIGEATEFGWKFNSKVSGLENFEFAKVKKLG